MPRLNRKGLTEERPKAGAGPEGGSRLRSPKAAEDMEHLNARIPSELMTQLRVHCARNRVSIQNVVTEAIDILLSRSD
jgi:hypothetical protein